MSYFGFRGIAECIMQHELLIAILAGLGEKT